MPVYDIMRITYTRYALASHRYIGYIEVDVHKQFECSEYRYDMRSYAVWEN